MAKIKTAINTAMTNKHDNTPEVTQTEQTSEANAPETTAPEVIDTEQTAPEVTTPISEIQDTDNAIEWLQESEDVFVARHGEYMLGARMVAETTWEWATAFNSESVNPRRSNNMASSLRLAKKFAEQAFELHRIKNS